MKKKIVIGTLFTLCLLMLFAGCASEKPAKGAEGGVPDWVLKARRDAPEDVIVGIGTANMATKNMSMNQSESRARAQISRAMQSMVKNMIEDYTSANELDSTAAVSFQQEITVALSKADLVGARIVEQNSDPSGSWWTVVYYNKSQTSTTINQAQAAAKLAVPAALAFRAEERMDEKFEQAAREEWLGDSDRTVWY